MPGSSSSFSRPDAHFPIDVSRQVLLDFSQPYSVPLWPDLGVVILCFVLFSASQCGPSRVEQLVTNECLPGMSRDASGTTQTKSARLLEGGQTTWDLGE